MTSMDEGQSQITGSYLKRCEETIRAIFWHRPAMEKASSDSGEPNLVSVVSRQVSTKEETMADKSLGIIRIELERTQESLDAELARLGAVIQKSALAGNAMEAKATLDVLLRLGDVRRILSDALGSLASGGTSPVTPVYTTSSWFLNDCFRYLVQREVEALHFVTGVQFSRILTLDRMVTFKMSHQTAGSASGDVNSTHKALIEMETYGHKLHACFHSHPGKGQAATFPSSIDLDYQARLDKGGYAAIGGIFSRDGYFRAFSLEKPFKIVVYGKGVEKIDERVFKLTEVD